MAKESKVNANVLEKNVKTHLEQVLTLYRENFSNDEREMFGYFIKGIVKDKDGELRDTKVDFVAYDQGGYEVLDMIFGFGGTPMVDAREESMTGEDGKPRSYMTYYAVNVDEDGDVLECRLKLARDSDKSIFNYIIKKAKKADAKSAEGGN